MDAMLLIDTVLASTSAIMALTLALAWRMFDRPPHALTWAIAFLCGVGQWTITAFHVELGSGPAHWLACSLVTVMMALIAVGTRQRARRPPRAWRFGAACAGAAAVLAPLTFMDVAPGLRLVWTNLPPAALLLVALEAAWDRRRRINLAERFLGVSLIALATLCLTLSGTALMEQGAGTVYLALLGYLLPPLGIALGVALCLVLAGDLNDRLHALVTRDPLTGALNRRGLEQAAQVAVASARRHRRPLTLIVADLDRFKAINDAQGHAAGDHALRTFARAANDAIRAGDLLARLGGDEFCLLLSEASGEAALRVVERLRRAAVGEVTASFGLATLSPNESLDELVARADAALYRAKANGRDRAVVAAAA